MVHMGLSTARSASQTVKSPSMPLRKRSSGRLLQVSFGSVQIRDYAMTLGDNPSCSYGAPVQLDWIYNERASQELDDYEATRPKRRTMRQMVLNYYMRCDILEAAGVPNSDIRRAQAKVNRAKRQRNTTQFFTPANLVGESVRGAGTELKSVFRKKRTTEPQ